MKLLVVIAFALVAHSVKAQTVLYQKKGNNQDCVECQGAACQSGVQTYTSKEACEASKLSPTPATSAATPAATEAATTAEATTTTDAGIPPAVFRGITIPPPGAQLSSVGAKLTRWACLPNGKTCQPCLLVNNDCPANAKKYTSFIACHTANPTCSRAVQPVQPVKPVQPVQPVQPRTITHTHPITHTHVVHEQKPPPEPTGCRDRDHECASFAKRGECKRNPIWMHPNCPRSCRRCGNPPPIVDPTYRPPPIVDPTHRPPPIVDPTHRPPPPVGCNDRDHECVPFAIRGECEKNPIWMIPNCPRACKRCGLPEPVIEPVRPTPRVIIEPVRRITPGPIIEPVRRITPGPIIEPQPYRPRPVKPRPQVIIEPVRITPGPIIEPVRPVVKPKPYPIKPVKPSGYHGTNPPPIVLPAVKTTKNYNG